ncbi:unnamed protein product [Gongylonema pulchrum]|uniref:Conserved plasma membrane protein n=1 Tax=Gongylonema pulchrum TaxID=637853 RepID=A0A183DK07_9BILA|nr:unnamed protein product [Gongylonema pulchrum]
MLRSSKVDQEELIRRESYLRDNSRPFVWADPTTWPRRWGVTFFAVGSGLLSWKYYCDWARKPFFYSKFGVFLCFSALHLSLYPRLAALAFLGTVGYVVGCLREYHYKTRDAVVEHYATGLSGPTAI